MITDTEPHIVIQRDKHRTVKCLVRDPRRDDLVIDLPITEVDYQHSATGPGYARITVHGFRIKFEEVSDA